MGLDQYAYVAMKAGEDAAYWSDRNYDKEDGDPTKLPQPRELAYWRKHPNLQGWMEQLWHKKGFPGVDAENGEHDPMFNGIELELTWEDLDQLEQAVKAGELPETTGFFFGEGSDNYYKAQDLQFIINARAELFCGFKVFYNSSW